MSTSDTDDTSRYSSAVGSGLHDRVGEVCQWWRSRGRRMPSDAGMTLTFGHQRLDERSIASITSIVSEAFGQISAGTTDPPVTARRWRTALMHQRTSRAWLSVTSATEASWVSWVSSVPCVVGRGCPSDELLSIKSRCPCSCRNDSTTHTDLTGLAEHSSAQHNQ